MFGKQLLSHFQELQNPRIERTKRHLLLDIIGLMLFAVLAGADTWEDIEDYGRLKHPWLKKFLRLPNGIPSHDTIERVLRRLKPRGIRGVSPFRYSSVANASQNAHRD